MSDRYITVGSPPVLVPAWLWQAVVREVGQARADELASDPETRAIPVIMVTSKAQESDRVWGLRQGAVDYLVKPVATEQLVRKAQAAIAT